jgi:acetyl/propionyl-CoA carboxylase alpha subunit
MAEALRRTVVLGVVTNTDRLQAIVDHPAFRAGALHTGFLDEHLRDLSREECPPPEALAAVAAALAIAPPASAPARGATAAPALRDPWATAGPWRLGG